MITPRLAPAVIFAALQISTVQAANPMRGHLLYENFCHHCHWADIHYRVNREVDSRDDLLRMVAMWQKEMRLGWHEEEVADVASYLDWVYYRFPGSRQSWNTGRAKK